MFAHNHMSSIKITWFYLLFYHHYLWSLFVQPASGLRSCARISEECAAAYCCMFQQIEFAVRIEWCILHYSLTFRWQTMIYCFSLSAIKRTYWYECIGNFMDVQYMHGVPSLVLLELQLIGHYMEVPFTFILLLCIQFPRSKKNERMTHAQMAISDNITLLSQWEFSILRNLNVLLKLYLRNIMCFDQLFFWCVSLLAGDEARGCWTLFKCGDISIPLEDCVFHTENRDNLICLAIEYEQISF